SIVQNRRRAVIAHVADLLAMTARALDRECESAYNLVAVGRHLHPMIGVAGRSVPVDRCVNLGAPRACPILALEHDHPCAFTEHEAVSAAIERARTLGPGGGCG